MIQLFEGPQPEPQHIQPIRNRDHMKPYGGLWTSTYLESPNYSEWIRWCVMQRFRGPLFECWLLTPKLNARVLTIDDLASWEALSLDANRYHDDVLQFIDWESLSQLWDGIRVTQDFINQYRLEWNFRYHVVLYSWDVESTLWFRWMFDDVQSLGAITIPFENDVQ